MASRAGPVFVRLTRGRNANVIGDPEKPHGKEMYTAVVDCKNNVRKRNVIVKKINALLGVSKRMTQEETKNLL